MCPKFTNDLEVPGFPSSSLLHPPTPAPYCLTDIWKFHAKSLKAKALPPLPDPSVFAVCGYRINLPKTKGPKTNGYYLAVPVGQEFRSSWTEKFWLSLSHEVAVKVSVRASVRWRLVWGRRAAYKAAHSHGRQAGAGGGWKASAPPYVGLSASQQLSYLKIQQLAFPSMGTPRAWGRSDNVFSDLASKVMCCPFHEPSKLTWHKSMNARMHGPLRVIFEAGYYSLLYAFLKHLYPCIIITLYLPLTVAEAVLCPPTAIIPILLVSRILILYRYCRDQQTVVHGLFFYNPWAKNSVNIFKGYKN